MPQKKHKPEEIVAKLRQVDVLVSQGQSVAEAVRSIGVTQFTYYRWRKEFGGLKTDQVKRALRYRPCVMLWPAGPIATTLSGPMQRSDTKPRWSLPPNSPQWAISLAHMHRCADRPLLRRRNRAKFSKGLWSQLDEHRGHSTTCRHCTASGRGCFLAARQPSIRSEPFLSNKASRSGRVCAPFKTSF